MEGAVVQAQRSTGSGHSGLGAALPRQRRPHPQLQRKGQQQRLGHIDRQDGGPARVGQMQMCMGELGEQGGCIGSSWAWQGRNTFAPANLLHWSLNP